MQSFKPCGKFLVCALGGYAGSGLLATDWYIPKKKNEITAYAKVYL